MHGKSARDWLTLSSDAKSLLAQVNRLRRLRESFAGHVTKTLATTATVSSCSGGIVVIAAANGAIAHKLKLVSTSLLEEFRKQDQEVTQIRIVVQGTVPATPEGLQKRALLPAAALEPLERLVDRLPESPLRTALARLASRQKR